MTEKTSYHSMRDSMMADIFLGDYKQRVNVKGIVIMSAYHALNNFRNSIEIERSYVKKETHILNEILHKSISSSIYSICFVSASGSYGAYNYGRRGFEEKVKTYKKSIEYYFKESPYDFFYSDLETLQIKDSFPSAIIFGETVCAPWAQIYSGLFFVKKMYPVKLLHREKHTFQFDIDDTVYEDILREK